MNIESSYPQQYKRITDFSRSMLLISNPDQKQPVIPSRIFGNFLEHLGFAIQGGVSAQELSNPVFSRETNLSSQQIQELLHAGKLLSELFLNHGDPEVLPPLWTPGIEATGFGVAALDEASETGLPFPWSPLGQPGYARASVGRIGGAIRLMPTPGCVPEAESIDLENGPAGIRQGIFLPLGRILKYHGYLWARLSTLNPDADGHIEVGFRRRVGTEHNIAGERIACKKLRLSGNEWQKVSYHLSLPEGSTQAGEPLDLYLRWQSEKESNEELLIDQVMLYPDDAVDGLDPEVIQLAKQWPVPLLRWPGGNFVSYYHWRDGMGPIDLRPVRFNYAWHGLEYNLFGIDEFMNFCKLIGAEPQITVNTGTGSPEEAAAWVEYCNGSPETHNGKIRSENGHSQPYNVKLWEVGNENFGFWQGGYHGSDENARRFGLFAKAMHAVDQDVQLIATGNAFDFVGPGSRYDNTTTDYRWHDKILVQTQNLPDFISLHCLPVNDNFLEHLSQEQAYQAIMAQPTTWELKFLPDLLCKIEDAQKKAHSDSRSQKPIELAITEWGILGNRRDRAFVENFGEAIYAGLFLNMMIRNYGKIGVANATALLHGGCIRKVGGSMYFDPQYIVIQKYARMVGATPLACAIEAPGFDVARSTDLGASQTDLSYLDAVACWSNSDAGSDFKGLQIAIVNRHFSRSISLTINLPQMDLQGEGREEILVSPDPAAKATPAIRQPFPLKEEEIRLVNHQLSISLPAVSVCWIQIPAG